MVMYICLNFTHSKVLELQEDPKNSSSQTRALTKTNSHSWRWQTGKKCIKNLTAANISGFSFLSDTYQDFLFYRHCRHFPILLDVPDKCGGATNSTDVFLLLVIKSSPANFNRREVLRKTWAKEREHNGMLIRRIFISGTMERGFEKERLNQILKLEQSEYNDILQWDFQDSFFNLTLKQILFFEWMERNCAHVRFLLNGDDDVFVNTDNVIEYLQGLKDNNRSQHLFTGHVFLNSKPVRWTGSKYFVPLQVDGSDSYPPYCGGGGIIMSGYTASVIYNTSHSIIMNPIDDVYMGMCLEKAGLSPVSHMGVKTLGWYVPSSKLDKYDPCYFKDLLLVHRFLPGDMYLMWKKIHDPSLKCGNSNKWLPGNRTIYKWQRGVLHTA